jgi:hypothetical protein
MRVASRSKTYGKSGELIRETVHEGEPRAAAEPLPEGHVISGVSRLMDSEGRTVLEWVKTKQDALQTQAAQQAAFEALRDELPRAEPEPAPGHAHNPDLLSQYTLTDLHLGMLAWHEETGADYDIKIAERLFLDWFGAAVAMAPNSKRAVFAQLGDFLHYDSKIPVTPAHRNIVDTDSRHQKMIRVGIRMKRHAIRLLLAKHEHVTLIVADANHDESGGDWMREMFAAFYDHEPRLTVDTTAGSYYAVEHGDVALFYHHGHKRKPKEVDRTFAGRYRQLYGNTKFAYAHTGHEHHDGLFSSQLMKTEQHETLASPDAYAANKGYLAGRSSKVITYHKNYGEVSRITLTPEMVAHAVQDQGIG